MLVIPGYIDGNTVVAIDSELNNFSGSEILFKIVEKPKTQTAVQNSQAPESERMKGLKAIQGVLKLDKKLTMEDIRKERLAERYGL